VTQNVIPNVSTDEASQFKQNLAIQALHRVASASREILTAARTYYVRDGGSDTNTGLVNTDAGAFLTLQKAWDSLLAIDTNGYTVTIKVTGTAFTKGISITKGWSGGGAVIVVGDNTTPANAVITQSTEHSSGGPYPGAIFLIESPLPAPLRISGFQLSTSGDGTAAILMAAPGALTIGGLTLAGNTASIFQGSIAALSPAAFITVAPAYGNITISGNMDCWLQVNAPGAHITFFTQTITLTGTPAWGWLGVYCSRGVIDGLGAVTFSGAATGTRYYVAQNGIIDTAGSGATHLPGDAAGSAVTQGQYV
jgi:hypothetical protein